jgi:twitching motility protein PilT
MSINDFFSEAINLKASDLHLSVNAPVFFRINGSLKSSSKWPILNQQKIVDLISEIISEKQKKDLLENKYLEFSYQNKEKFRFRVSVFYEKNNLALAARLILSKIPTLEEIGLTSGGAKLTEAKTGLVLITGPTGCGKSTTLAAMIDEINQKRESHIITLEDPIEFLFKNKKSLIAQRELGKDTPSFGLALKHIVRQDPDVILVSEMRDLETISLAITLAETGHLVLSTVHTPSAPQTIDRIIDVFPYNQQEQIRLQVALALKGVITQFLLPKIGGGRVAAREILINTPAVSNLIRENKIAQIKSVMQNSGQQGMQTLEKELKHLYQNKIIKIEDALAHANYPQEIIN